MSYTPQMNINPHASNTPLQGTQLNTPTPPSGGPSKPTYSKRGKITIVACVNCRRRKTKCDGQRPICGQCRARDGTQCHYDMNEEQRRLTFLRENVEQLHEEKSSLETLIYNLRISSEPEAIEILRRLRHGTDPQTLSQSIQAGRTLAQVSRPGAEGKPSVSSLRPDVHAQLVASIVRATPGEIDEIVRRLRLHEDVGQIMGVIHAGTLLQPLEKSGQYAQPEQAFGLTRVGPATPTSNQRQVRPGQQPSSHLALTLQGNRSASWMGVSGDQDVINHSLGLYFSWQHCFFQSFPQKLFLQDMANGNDSYCSKQLVNAIASAGCLLSPWPELPSGNVRPLELSHKLFDEAMYGLNLLDTPSIPTVAGLFILSHIEGNRGRMHRAWDLCGRSVRMALDLNLHIKSAHRGTDEVESMARNHTFWGCFIADQLASFTLGRIPQIPVTAITIDLPTINQEDDQAPWEPFGDHSRTKIPGARSTTFLQVVSLSKILNSTLSLFFAPSQVIKGSLLLDEYNKYIAWFNRLPPIVHLKEDSTPHVLSLHMYYHAAVLLLFRPFLKAKFTQSDISPSDVCRSSAAAISQIFDQHRRMYDSVGIYTLQIHCLLAACTIHIINTPAIAATQYLTSAANHFHHLSQINGWAAECINILKNLGRRWNIVLPLEAEHALYQDAVDDAPPNEADSGRGKRSAFGQPNVPPTPQQKKQKLAAPRVLGQQQQSTSSLSDSSSISVRGKTTNQVMEMGTITGATQSSPEAASEVTIVGQQANYLFAPFPGQPAPMLGPTHTSSTTEVGIEHHMLLQSNSEFDGLTFEVGTGWFDPFMGFELSGNFGSGEQSV